MNKLSDYLRITEAAAYLGVSTNTLRTWEKQRKIKVYRCPQNNYRMYKKKDLDNCLKRMANNWINKFRPKRIL